MQPTKQKLTQTYKLVYSQTLSFSLFSSVRYETSSASIFSQVTFDSLKVSFTNFIEEERDFISRNQIHDTKDSNGRKAVRF